MFFWLRLIFVTVLIVTFSLGFHDEVQASEPNEVVMLVSLIGAFISPLILLIKEW
jgi:hypothetical protein